MNARARSACPRWSGRSSARSKRPRWPPPARERPRRRCWASSHKGGCPMRGETRGGGRARDALLTLPASFSIFCCFIFLVLFISTSSCFFFSCFVLYCSFYFLCFVCLFACSCPPPSFSCFKVRSRKRGVDAGHGQVEAGPLRRGARRVKSRRQPPGLPVWVAWAQPGGGGQAAGVREPQGRYSGGQGGRKQGGHPEEPPAVAGGGRQRKPR